MLSLNKETLFDPPDEADYETNIKNIITDANHIIKNTGQISNSYVVDMKYMMYPDDTPGYYSGPVYNGIPYGRGMFKFLADEKNTYIGDFDNGIPNGYGCTTNTDYICRGQIKNGKYQGQVYIKFKNKDTYRGKMEQGIIHGQGEYTFCDGTKLTGLFLDQMFHSGTAVYSDGIICKGYFVNVIIVSGIKVYPNNTTEKGIFKDGYLHYGSRIKDDVETLHSKKKIIQTGVFYKDIFISDQYSVISLDKYRAL